jgi:hypothetical protein
LYFVVASVLHSNVNLEDAIERVRNTRHDRGDYSDDEDEDDQVDEETIAFKSDVAAIKEAAIAANAKPQRVKAASTAEDSTDPITPTGLIRKDVSETRITEFVAATADHFKSRTFQGLTPAVPEGQSTDIQMGQFGIARSYQPIQNDK